jgi:hypothetical protein
VPELGQDDWSRDPLDRFVLARMRQAGLSPAPEAGRAAWLRRAALDLTGLPPSPEEVATFERDRSEDAYEQQVDRLLAMPAYGERLAQMWLDLARYADSQGYEKDALRRSVWRWRDQVVAAFNADQPFDEFTIEQLAGDLLPDATIEQRVATAFHRHTMTNSEGGTDDEEFRSAAVVDRVNTTFSVWMGTTMACAQCHDHKYDPFSQREYFQLYAFFNQTADADRNDEAPVLQAPTPAQVDRAAVLRDRLAALPDGADQLLPNLRRWHAEQKELLQQFEAAAVTVSPWQLCGPVPAAGLDAAFARGFDGSLEVAREQGLAFAERADFTDGVVHALTGANASFLLERTVSVAKDTAAVLRLGSDDAIEVWCNGDRLLSRRVARAAAPDQESVEVRLRAGDNRIRLAISNGGGPGGFYFALLPPAVGGVDDVLDEDDVAVWRAADVPELAEWQSQQDGAERELALLGGPQVPVMQELFGKARRTTRIHARGDYRSLGDVVEPGVPAILPPLPEGAPRDRLGLARWIVAADNPLTARVQVNRLWGRIFGRGLVPTGEDFGTQGDRPSHPQLLDHLASGFLADGWSIKRLMRRIVLSATYRQAAVADEVDLQRDRDNLWLSRGPAVRLSAELLRDQALAVAGLLTRRLGGPSVMPDQPDGIWSQIYSGDRWQVSPGADRYRRSLYTIWRRTAPHPAMVTFDAPSREFCVTDRVRTNTPLQALVTWNEAQFVAAARALAGRVLAEDHDSDESRVERMFRLCLLRGPEPLELQRLVDYLRGELRHFHADPDAAGQLLQREPGEDAARAAAWTMLANVLMNLDEFVTKT